MQDLLSYNVGSKIGQGLNGDVYNCYDTCLADGSRPTDKFALKIFKTAEEFNCEMNMLNELNHPNILKIVHKEDNKMVMHFYENGDLFDFLQQHGRQIITEEIARFFFKQLLAAVEYVHSRNIVHRDIKLENILVDQDFNLILSDFGLSAKVERGQLLKQYIGTTSYMAPEIITESSYYGQSSDIFSMGVILFCLVIGTYPFQSKAVATDPHYKYFAQKKYLRYWALVEKQTNKSFSYSFKNLVNSMLSYDMNERITIEEIKDHEWLTDGPTATAEDIRIALQQLQQQQPQQD